MTLFREEVSAAQAANSLGSVRLHRPLSFTVVTGMGLASALALVAFAAWGDVNRKARLSGLLVPKLGSLNIAAPQSGVLLELPVAEGQTVQAGDVLMVLNTERRTLVGGTVFDTSERVSLQIEARQQTLATEATLRQLQSTQREQALSDRIRTLQAELRQALEGTELAQRRVQLAQTTLARNEQLAAEGFVAAAQVQSRQEELIDATFRLQSAQRSVTALERDLQSVQSDRKALATQLDADLNQLERSRASLSQEAGENAARKSTVITAPHAGTVTALNIRVGQSVQSGQNLATLVPVSATATDPHQAQLFAPSRTAGFVRPGQAVYLRYAAYPYQRFGLHTGRITSVSATPFAPSELPPNLAQQLLAQAGSNEAPYRINVRLDAQSIQAYGENVMLKPGLTLEADVLQERRKVWEWMLEPVLAVRQQVKVLNADPTQGRAGG